jgi:hypothetical protein
MTTTTMRPRAAWAAQRSRAVRAVVLFGLGLLGALVLVSLLLRWIANFLAELAAMAELQASARAQTRPYGLMVAKLLAEDYAAAPMTTTSGAGQ